MTLTRYGIGFVLSLLLTFAAYGLAVYGSASAAWIVIMLGLLAIVQLVVQLVFFLHLGDEAGPRYKLVSFVFMAGILLIVVVGSLWIMAHLNDNMMQMTPLEKTQYMRTQFDKGF